MRAAGEGWRLQPLAEGAGSRQDGPLPPGVLIPEQWPLVLPGLGEGASGGEEGARGRSGRLLSSRHPDPAPGNRSGRPSPASGRGRGAQTKGACAFKAGSRGAGGEGTSGSGVEGGCAGQQGGGAGRADGGRPEGRPGRAGTEQDRGTAGPPAGARGGGGAGARGRRRPRPAGETRPGAGGAGARCGWGTPRGSRSFSVGAEAGGRASRVFAGSPRPLGRRKAVGEEMGAPGSRPRLPAARVPSSTRSPFPTRERRARGRRRPVPGAVAVGEPPSLG